MSNKPEAHQMKGNSSDIYRAALNAENSAMYWQAIASELFTLLSEAQHLVVLNPASGDLRNRIQTALNKHSEPTPCKAVEEETVNDDNTIESD